jgi:hypothetical protein
LVGPVLKVKDLVGEGLKPSPTNKFGNWVGANGYEFLSPPLLRRVVGEVKNFLIHVEFPYEPLHS